MPISQLTVLALYGELYNLVAAVDRLKRASASPNRDQTFYEMLRDLREEIDLAASRASRAQAAAIEIVLRDAHGIEINPLTGEAS
jgi:hypothetical protein